MFGVIDRLMLRAPAYVVDPERLMGVAIGRAVDGQQRSQRVLSYPIYQDMKSARDAFEHVAVYASVDLAFGRGRDARELQGMRVTANYFAALGVRPVAGRFFLPEEAGNPTAPNVAVIGYGFWQRQYDGSRSVIGRTLTIGQDAYTDHRRRARRIHRRHDRCGRRVGAVDRWRVRARACRVARQPPGSLAAHHRATPADHHRGTGVVDRDGRLARRIDSSRPVAGARCFARGDHSARVGAAAPRPSRQCGRQGRRVARRGVDSRAAHCVCERREPSAGSRHRARARSRRSHRTRYRPSATRQTTGSRDGAVGTGRRCCRHRGHDLGWRDRAERHVHGRSRCCAGNRRSSRRLHGVRRRRGGGGERHPACRAIEPASSGGCVTRRRARRRASAITNAQRAPDRAGGTDRGFPRGHGAVRAQPEPHSGAGVRHGTRPRARGVRAHEWCRADVAGECRTLPAPARRSAGSARYGARGGIDRPAVLDVLGCRRDSPGSRLRSRDA